MEIFGPDDFHFIQMWMEGIQICVRQPPAVKTTEQFPRAISNHMYLVQWMFFLLFVLLCVVWFVGFLFELRILVVVMSIWRNWFSVFVSASLSAGPFAVLGFCFVVARTLVNRGSVCKRVCV